MEFKVGDKIILKGENRPGVILSIQNDNEAHIFYKIKWDGGHSKNEYRGTYWIGSELILNTQVIREDRLNELGI